MAALAGYARTVARRGAAVAAPVAARRAVPSSRLLGVGPAGVRATAPALTPASLGLGPRRWASTAPVEVAATAAPGAASAVTSVPDAAAAAAVEPAAAAAAADAAGAAADAAGAVAPSAAEAAAAALAAVPTTLDLSTLQSLVWHVIDVLHETVGLPWWGAVVGATAILRVAALPVVLRAQIIGARMQVNHPKIQAVMDKMNAARERKDQAVSVGVPAGHAGGDGRGVPAAAAAFARLCGRLPAAADELRPRTATSCASV
jgi:hypothetical protein